MPEQGEDKMIYKVVANGEEQYSISPTHREDALGWRDAGKSVPRPHPFRQHFRIRPYGNGHLEGAQALKRISVEVEHCSAAIDAHG